MNIYNILKENGLEQKLVIKYYLTTSNVWNGIKKLKTKKI